MDETLRVTLLYDFYEELLTEKQRQIYQMHYLDDFSLSEVGEQFDITRQAVHDILLRTEKKLLEWEQKLKLVEKYIKIKNMISELSELTELNGNEDNGELINRLDCISQSIKHIEEEL